MHRAGIADVRPSAPHRRGRRMIAPACGAALLALAGCSAFGSKPEPPAVDPNVNPTNYRAVVMTFLQTNPAPLIGTREAMLAPPTLQPFGNESRYVVCLRAIGPDFRKEKAIIFFGGEINQFVDATPQQCGSAAYQPFPELPTLLARLSGSRK
jgi:hypothetical protein